jgi:hypothetical protein
MTPTEKNSVIYTSMIQNDMADTHCNIICLTSETMDVDMDVDIKRKLCHVKVLLH